MAVNGIPTGVLIAPDSFKGTLSADEVAAAIARGVERGGHEADRCPAGDGGEGTLEALAGPLALSVEEVTVSDPLGRPVAARFGLGDGVALVEVAAASGLGLVEPAERDPVAASTAGTGELILAALDAGAQTIYVAAGGSATTDGGRGALQVLDRAGGQRATRLVVLCDVRTSFEDAADVFAPQKGATPEQVDVLGRRLDAYARTLPRDPRGAPMTGAAGGLSGSLWAACGAELVPGAAFVLDQIGFDARMRAARIVVTGEGRIDHQSLAGKVVAEVATRSRQAGVPCAAIVGQNALGSFEQRILDLETITEAGTVAALEAAGAELAGRL